MKSLRLDLTKILILLGIMLLLLIGLIGCGDSGIVAPSGNENNVSVSIMNDEGAMIRKPEDNEVPPDPEFKEGTSGSHRYSFII